MSNQVWLSWLILLRFLDLSLKWHRYFASCVFCPWLPDASFSLPTASGRQSQDLSILFCPKVKPKPTICLRHHDESVAEFFLFYNWVLTMDYFIFLELTPECIFFPFLWSRMWMHVFCLSQSPISFFFRLTSFLYKSHPTPIPVIHRLFLVT